MPTLKPLTKEYAERKPTVYIGTRVPRALRERAERAAAQSGLTLSRLVRNILDEALATDKEVKA